MTRLTVAPIVEGHGEQEAVRILIDRVWREIVRGEFAKVFQPVRMPKSKLVKPEELGRAVDIAATKLR